MRLCLENVAVQNCQILKNQKNYSALQKFESIQNRQVGKKNPIYIFNHFLLAAAFLPVVLWISSKLMDL